MTDHVKGTHGGKRANAGRPKDDGEGEMIYIPKELVESVRDEIRQYKLDKQHT